MSSIEVALIPPGKLAEHYSEGRMFQMALAGNLLDTSQVDYREFYNQAWKSHRAEWLLDNGAWETETLPADQLLSLARSYRATEVMAPDVLYEPLLTWEKTSDFLSHYRGFYGRNETLGMPKPKIAAVAHGRTIDAAMAFVQHIADHAPEIRTIAISRTVCYRTGNPTARMELSILIKRAFKERFKIHLLGYSDHWPTELQCCNSFPGLVRSMDTIAPFAYTHFGYRIQEAGTVKVPRPDNYFDMDHSRFDMNLLDENIRALDAIARGSLYKGTV